MRGAGGVALVVGLLVGLLMGLAACTGSTRGGSASPPVGVLPDARPDARPGGASAPEANGDATPLPAGASRDYTVAEAPALVDRDAYAFRTLSAVRPGATYRLRMPGNLYPVASGSRLAVELTVPGGGWWLFEQGVVTQQPSFVQEDAGVRVMELGTIPYGPCQDQEHPPADPGPTPADLARAIVTRYPLRIIEPASPVTRFGGSGVHLVARLDDPKAGLCDNNGLMTYRPMAGQHQLVELWVVVVRRERVLVERSWFPDTSHRVLADQQRVLASLRLVPL
ncbi:hypothetical protein [Intrasporangium flavum]|uniref:hypothetical protein n=1 Tax=Intrasporangium flavum TaxID=1428657 RepID=UPI00096D8E53|nr:hypothetical protein [Intrasporangium flavum]